MCALSKCDLRHGCTWNKLAMVQIFMCTNMHDDVCDLSHGHTCNKLAIMTCCHYATSWHDATETAVSVGSYVEANACKPVTGGGDASSV